ncbi:hypothetical protein CEXT_721631, partial [Caerostris extrusa]
FLQEKEVPGNKVHPQKGGVDNMSNKSYNGCWEVTKWRIIEKPSKETSRSSQNNDSSTTRRRTRAKKYLGEKGEILCLHLPHCLCSIVKQDYYSSKLNCCIFGKALPPTSCL